MMTGMGATNWATFDCFGTLVDWRHGIATSAELLFPGRGRELLDRYNAHELDVERETPTMRYRDVMAETLRRAARDLGLDLRHDDASILGDTIPYWPVFPEVVAELGGLRAAGWRLALLTNCDRDIIGATQRRLGVPIDAVVTAEHVGSYKPAHAHFERFEWSFAPGHDHWVHVAQSYTHDMIPARELGIRRVWINRLGEGDDPSICDAMLPDLHGLLASVEGARAPTASEHEAASE
jgi:2-haloacid dehalogenase